MKFKKIVIKRKFVGQMELTNNRPGCYGLLYEIWITVLLFLLIDLSIEAYKTIYIITCETVLVR